MDIREAKFSDIKRIIPLLEKAHDEFGPETAPFCPDTTRNTLQRVINQKEHCALILTDGEHVRGIMVGLTNQLWYSRKRQIADLIYYVDPDARGYGAKLLSAFLGWARNMPNVAEILVGITSGASNMDRLDGLFRAVGLKQVGGIYQLIPGETEHEQSA